MFTQLRQKLFKYIKLSQGTPLKHVYCTAYNYLIIRYLKLDGNYKFNIPKEMDVTDAHVGPMVNKYLTEGDPVLGRYNNMPFPEGETEVG